MLEVTGINANVSNAYWSYLVVGVVRLYSTQTTVIHVTEPGMDGIGFLTTKTKQLQTMCLPESYT